MKTEKQILDKIKELEKSITKKSIITKQALEWVLEIE